MHTHTHTQTTEKQRDQIDKSTLKEYLVKTWMTTSMSSKTQKKRMEWTNGQSETKNRCSVVKTKGRKSI